MPKLMVDYNIERCPKIAATHIGQQLEITQQALHKMAKKLGISLPKIGNKSFLTHNVAKQLLKISFNKQKIAFQIVKGGTGKTTALHNIACCASAYGARVLAIDLDPQGNLTDSFNYNPSESPVLIDIITKNSDLEGAIINVEDGIDLLPSRIENVVLDNTLALEAKPLNRLFYKILHPIEDNYDFIFIDCPPTMGHSVTAATLYAGMVLTPLNPDRYSAKGLEILKESISQMNKEFDTDVDYRVFLNRFSGNTILSDKAIQTTISEETESGKALSIAVRHSQEIPNTVDQGLNLFSGLKKSTAREDFDTLTRELLGIDLLAEKEAKARHQAPLELA
jgi:chromosome partitioning protein